MLKRQHHRNPDVQFCIEARLGGIEVVDRFTIEQESGPGCDNHRDERVYNTVQKHLNELSIKTRLSYEIVRWGDVKDRSLRMSGRPLGGD